jgi:hypothetical protein
VHVSATVLGDAGSSVGMFSVPVLAPIVDGSHRSVIVVLPPAATDGSVPQVCPVVHDPNANEKFPPASPVIVMLPTRFSDTPPLFPIV